MGSSEETTSQPPGVGCLETKPPAAARFFVIFVEKLAILMPLDLLSDVFRAI